MRTPFIFGNVATKLLLLLAFLFANTALGQTSAAVADATPTLSESTEYHGFRVDDHLLSAQQKAVFLPSFIKQLTIVESVGLPVEALDFFREIPIVVDPTLREMPGQYTGTGIVRVQPVPMAGNKPILLHELLHAYHQKIVSLQNQDVIRAYQKEKQPGVFPANFQSAHFLENNREYFAVTASIFLFGDIQQPPFNCAIVAKNDPEYLAFLAGLFGPHPCK